MKHAGGRQITCHINTLVKDNRFRSQTKVKVTGRFYRRSRRDYMELDRLPDFL
jgi:uncharacterized beta-barrel protein YwiB (DUF1934 family)